MKSEQILISWTWNKAKAVFGSKVFFKVFEQYHSFQKYYSFKYFDVFGYDKNCSINTLVSFKL
jgi:hypothetical protein